MSINYQHVKLLLKKAQQHELINRLDLMKKNGFDLNVPKMPASDPYSQLGQISRLAFLEQLTGKDLAPLSEGVTDQSLEALRGNIEKCIGFAKMPVGVAGPLLVHGSAANGAFFIPLATTEGALVASYNRGCKAMTLSGGVRSVCLNEGVQRSPVFKFNNLIEVGKFIQWVVSQWSVFEQLTAETSNYAKLKDFKTNIEGNNCNLIFEFTTGDAAGQNMVTFCTNSICKHIIQYTPVHPISWYVESNLSGDKKANFQSFQNVRGKKVVSEVTIPKAIVEQVLKSTPEAIEAYWKTSIVSQVQLGTIGAQGHIANGLTALFIACGQDVACISEASVGISRFEMTENGDLYASVSLPNLIVGTVGGGTGLPTQKACLEIMDCHGPGKAIKLAEICGGLALAGEISIAAALASGHFVTAHKNLGRK